MNTRTISIAASSAFALLLIAGSYLAATPGGILVALHVANAQSSEEVLRAYAVKDTDGDGLPDWQENLYGTDPNNPSSVKAGITDSEAVTQGLVKPKVSSVVATSTDAAKNPVIPGESPAANTLTDQFSQEFFQAYIQASGGQQMSDADQQALVTKLLGSFSTRATQLISSHYDSTSIRISKTITATEYAGAVEALLTKNSLVATQTSPIELANNLMNNGDESARTTLKKQQKVFANIAAGLLTMPVPPVLAADHLMLLQAFDSDARATALVADYEKDPVAVLGAISVYKPSGDGVSAAFKDIAKAVLAEGEPAEGTPGADIVRIVRKTQ